MAKCMACGKSVLLTSGFGKIVLCKNCGTLINVSAWNKREFVSINELMERRNFALQKASENGMSQGIIGVISAFFDEYVKNGYVTFVDGKAGQTLKVFSNYCIVTTKNDIAKTGIINNWHIEEFDDEKIDDSVLSADEKKSLVKGIMSGHAVRSGIGVAVSASLNKQEQEKERERLRHEKQKTVEQLISVGERRINLTNIENIEVFCESNAATGYLKFIPQGISSKNLSSCEYFFFNNTILFGSKKIKQEVENVKNWMLERLSWIEREKQQAAAAAEQNNRICDQTAQQNKPDVFDEVRKFKQLLDEGIISEEEFNFKKKQLLGV